MKILLCAGTRPNFIKIAPLYHTATKLGIQADILHTGQHYDSNLSDIFFKELNIPSPTIQFNVESNTRDEYISKVSKAVEDFLSSTDYDYVITVGDVNSTLACTKGANLADVKVAHVEAGLRSHDMRMPEEINRLDIDRIADLHFVSEPDGVVNLKNESLYDENKCFLVGNVVIDNLFNNLSHIREVKQYEKLGLETKAYALATLHRPSNVDDKDRLEGILKTISDFSKQTTFVLPLHPRTKARISEFKLDKYLKDVKVIEPQGYFEFANLLMNSKFIVTDSGGAQEESMVLKVPCITIRANTERPITILSGTSVLAGEDLLLLQYYIRLALEDRLNKGGEYKLWDGKASERVLTTLHHLQ
ncbi:MAG TPA: UDP-N-acetylglucosamine 2-epimerase (non-hydrolyzing) [Candidatus Dojkabacteria bacterium]|nr:UDP-N-acetylglucosamine 2-epimerase (non-hydrolyzing) [Candidatus Dojkabacteria bacterium]